LKSLIADLKLATDPVQFAKLLGIEPDPWQETALRYRGKKLLLCCSRQSGKSTVSAILALHKVIFNPGVTVLLVSPSARQSSELFSKVTGLIKQLPVKLEKIVDNRLSVVLANGSRIISLPSSESTIRGYSADLVIMDESARISDVLMQAVSPMVSVSGGALILLSTPAGCRGHFYNFYIDENSGWEKITITADQCPRIDPEWLVKERDMIGDLFWRQEYMVEFVQNSDSLFTIEQINDAFDSDFDMWDLDIKREAV
jgi:hypothetical protein